MSIDGVTCPHDGTASKPKSALKAAIIPVTDFQQNCSLIWDDVSKVGAVVDPGGDLDLIERGIKEAGITIEKILLTHGHIDHAGGADELRGRLGVKIEGPHLADKLLLDALDQARPSCMASPASATSRRTAGWTKARPSPSPVTRSRFFIARGIRRVRWCFSTAGSGLRLSVTCCFAVRSGAPIFPTAITMR